MSFSSNLYSRSSSSHWTLIAYYEFPVIVKTFGVILWQANSYICDLIIAKESLCNVRKPRIVIDLDLPPLGPYGRTYTMPTAEKIGIIVQDVRNPGTSFSVSETLPITDRYQIYGRLDFRSFQNHTDFIGVGGTCCCWHLMTTTGTFS